MRFKWPLSRRQPSGEWLALRHQQARPAAGGLLIGSRLLGAAEALDAGPAIGPLPGAALAAAARAYDALGDGAARPQLAALAYDAAGKPRALDHYAPITAALGADELPAFDALTGRIAAHPTFAIRLIGRGGRDESAALPASARRIAAQHIAEIFFYRQDILDHALSRRREIRLYASDAAFVEDGGIAGGDYDPGRRCVQLLLSRLFEGFNGPLPGVAPFLHELGHLLDDLGAEEGRRAAGLLPGLSPEDGPIFTPEARALFAAGKRLELERFLEWQRPRPASPMPLGHPYVLQNDGEFCAGYLEMFLRNPHAFAAANPALYEGYMTLLRYDPRTAMAEDFPFYVAENRRFYESGQQRSWRAGVTIPG